MIEVERSHCLGFLHIIIKVLPFFFTAGQTKQHKQLFQIFLKYLPLSDGHSC